MELIPAIDLKDGQCVRLLKGDFGAQTKYAANPLELAREYAQAGAAWLHVVDLDGAQAGRRTNREIVAKLADIEGLKLQIGGGIRDEVALVEALETADRVVVGSAALAKPEAFRGWLAEHGEERVVLALDVTVTEDGNTRVRSHGWQQDSGWTLAGALEVFAPMGLKHVLCTDIGRDGAMTGPNLDLYARCLADWPSIRFQASGGISSYGDLDRLQALGMHAVISGKALLENALTLEEAKPFLPNA